jgi:RHH-type transcriptional regulator, rel operon repressor / antitoxin RelB
MKEKVLTSRVSETKYDRVEKLSQVMNRSKSYILDEALDNYLDINEWQINETVEALNQANNPETEWVNHDDLESKWIQKLAN